MKYLHKTSKNRLINDRKNYIINCSYVARKIVAWLEGLEGGENLA